MAVRRRPRALPGRTETVTRTIHFYRWRTRDDTAPPFAPDVAARLIDRLAFSPGERYVELEDGRDLCVWCAGGSPNIRMQLGVVRRRGLPQIEDAGAFIPLSITDRQGLVEIAHLIFFPNNIVGAEFNFYGPRVNRLAQYLQERFPDELPPIAFDILLRQDIQEQLQRQRELKLVRLRLHRSHFALVDQARTEGVFSALRTTEQDTDAPVVELVLKTEAYSRESLSARILNAVKALAGVPEIKESAEVFKIRSREHVGEPFRDLDLLEDHLITTREIPSMPGRHRVIEAGSMFAAIDDAYRELQPALERAAGIGL